MTVPINNVLMFFKFGESRWINEIIKGNISFSCIGAFIAQARMYGNEIQGDLYEGVFARLNKDDKRIELMKNQLKGDLEIINDGEYIMLRRHSSKLVPIFCLYGITGKDLLVDNKNMLEKHPKGSNQLKHYFDESIYTGFSNYNIRNVLGNTRRLSTLYIQPEPFLYNVRHSILDERTKFKISKVNYDLFKNETFFIEPKETYQELFYKFPKYNNQYEIRTCLYSKKFSNCFERYNLKITPLIKDVDCYTLNSKLNVTIDAITKLK